MRLILEGGAGIPAVQCGGTLTPALELGVRQDGGDAETGTGMEAGARISFKRQGLAVEGAVRTLLSHEDEEYGEWGASASVRLEPGKDGRGLSFSVEPSWGATGSAAERLWGLDDTRGLAPEGEFEAGRRIDAEVGYGLAVFDGRFTGTPEFGLGLSDGNREYRIGWRLSPGGGRDRSARVLRDPHGGRPEDCLPGGGGEPVRGGAGGAVLTDRRHDPVGGFLAQVEEYLEDSGMAPSTFGILAAGDQSLVLALRRGRVCRIAAIPVDWTIPQGVASEMATTGLLRVACRREVRKLEAKAASAFRRHPRGRESDDVMTQEGRRPSKAFLVLGIAAGLAACGGGGGSSVPGETVTPPATHAQEITITPLANHAPRIVGTIPAQTLTENGTALSVDIAPYFRDPDGDLLTYSVTSSDPAIVTASISGDLMTLDPVSAGAASITVTVSDGNASALQTVFATVPGAPRTVHRHQRRFSSRQKDQHHQHQHHRLHWGRSYLQSRNHSCSLSHNRCHCRYHNHNLSLSLSRNHGNRG